MSEHYCQEHQIAFTEKTGKYGVFWSHKLGNNSYCNEHKEERAATTPSQTTPPSPPSAKPETTPTMTKEDWAEKDRITRKSSERQTSLNCAVAIAKQVDGVVTTGQIIATAKVFEAYLEGLPPKSRLAKEAEKLGVKEIDPNEH